MDIQIQCAAEALDQRHSASLGGGLCVAGILDEVRGDDAVDDAQYLTHDPGAGGEQEPQREREAQHPLAHRCLRQHLVYQQGRTLGHAPGTAAWAEATALTTEGHELLGMAVHTAHAQESVLRAAAFEVSVALFVAKIGIQLGWPAIRELVDTGLDKEQLLRIRRTILGVDGVRELHLLRTRRIGGRALVDVHIIVDEDISVSEGHYISEMVRTKLVNEVDVVADALVHIDPEDDTHSMPARDLPSRTAVHTQLKACFKDIDAAQHIERITLHYVGGRLRVELLMPLSVLAQPADGTALATRFQQAVANEPLIDSLDLRFH